MRNINILKVRKFLAKITMMIIFTIFAFAVSIFGVRSKYKSQAIEPEANNLNHLSSVEIETISHSIFINNPTYSFVYQENLYFFDSLDENLKIYSLNENKFHQTFLNTSEYGTLIDATICEEYIFALYKTKNDYSVQRITLNTNELISSKIASTEGIIDSNYSKINVIYFEENFYITLTPDFNSKSNIPLIMKLNKSEQQISNVTQIILNEQIKKSIFKVILEPSINNNFNIIFICNDEISSIIVEKNSLNDAQITLKYSITTLNSLDSANEKTKITTVNTCEINNYSYILITYINEQDSENVLSFTKLYKLEADSSTILIPNLQDEKITNTATKFLTSSQNGVTYPDSQDIIYKKIDIKEDKISFTEQKIQNPNLSVDYYEDSAFVYVKTNSKCELLSSPWNLNSPVEIDQNKDLIIIGEGIIGQNTKFDDYKYCMYTDNKSNHLGYVKTEYLEQKTEIPVSEDNKIIMVVDGTPLYSMPTKITETMISGKNFSSIIMKIQEYSRLEILDNLCGYISNSTAYVKVQVNGKEIGYIDKNQIQNKNEINIHVTNNATIKLDGAKLFLNESDTATVITTLEMGTRVQVNGTRNRKTGLTQVTFSDDYGNTFVGYVSSDYIQTDGWTNLQMIGSIFIAVNLGVLILIFYFKKKRLVTKETKSIIEKSE